MNARQKKLLVAAGLGIGLAAGWRAARRRRYSFADKVVVITGGSRGLGLVLARHFAAEGAALALIARDVDELRRAQEDVADGGGRPVLAIAADLRQQDQAEQAIAEVIEQFGRIDVLVNNAGVIQVGPIEHMTIADFQDALDIHLWAPLFTIAAALPHLRRRGEGRIVNISSFGGKVSVPHLVPYCTSKFALVGLSDGLRHELRKDGIYVTTVCPWLMRTGSPPNAFFKGRNVDEYTWFAIGGAPPGLSVAVDRAARKIIAACRAGDARLIMAAHARLLVFATELMPNLSASVMAAINRLLPPPTGPEGDELHTGWESFSRWAPSKLTRFSDRQTLRNNELPPRSAAQALWK